MCDLSVLMCCFPWKIAQFTQKRNDEKEFKKMDPDWRALTFSLSAGSSCLSTAGSHFVGIPAGPLAELRVLVQSDPTGRRANLCSVRRASVTGKLGRWPRVLRFFRATPEWDIDETSPPWVKMLDKKWMNELNGHGADRIILKMQLTLPWVPSSIKKLLLAECEVLGPLVGWSFFFLSATQL